MSSRLYAVHRWIGALIGLQLLAWTLGGLIFATHDLSRVHGDHTRRAGGEEALPLSRVKLDPIAAVARAGPVTTVDRIELRVLLGGPVYEVRATNGSVLVDAETGALRSPIDRTTAELVARADQRGSPRIVSVDWIQANPDAEYRELPLPAWRVVFDGPEGTHVYVDATTGQVRARRNDAWRRFDFFWMLHTMDYRARDDFNHPLLVAAATLAIASVLSGFMLWAVRVARAARRRRRPSRG